MRFALVLLVFFAGCCGPNLRPTVDLLKKSLEVCREDYVKGRVTYVADDKKANKKLVEGRIKRLELAIKNAEEALKKE